MINVIESDDYTALDRRDILYPAPEKYTTLIVAALPSAEDLRDEMRRAIRLVIGGAEFMPMGPGRYLKLERDGFATVYGRRRQYAQCSVSAEMVCREGPALVDDVRAVCLAGARRIGERIAGQIFAEYRSGADRGAVTVRTMTDVTMPMYMPIAADNGPTVFMAQCTDEFIIRLAAYYVIAPPGNEVIEP